MHATETASEQSPGETEAAKLAVQTKGALIPPPWSHPVRCKHTTSNAIFPGHRLQDWQQVPGWSLSQPSVWR